MARRTKSQWSQFARMGRLGACAGVALIARWAEAGISYNAVAAGDATSSDAILWTRALDSTSPAATSLTAQVSTDPNFGTVAATLNGSTDPAQDFTLKLDATGLNANTQYYYRFVAPGDVVSSTGTFKTAPAASQSVPLHFGFSGDVDGQWRPYPSVANIASQNYNFFVFLGDTMYETASGKTGTANFSPATADPFTNPTQALADYRGKYLQNISPVNSGGQAGLKNFFAAQGTYTLLDNHELGNKQFDNGGAAPGTPKGAGVDATNPANDVNTTGSFINQTTGFKVLEEAYNNYHPIREQTISAPSDPRTNGTQQLYYAQQWGKNAVFINADDRSYRDIRMKTTGGADDTGARADNPARTMLGATQVQWLEQSLLSQQQAGTPWKFVAVSSPIDQIGPIGGAFSVTNGAFSTGSDGGKSWMGGYRAERNALLKFIADNHINNVVFLSTDDHQTRINELDYSPTGQTGLQSSYVRMPGNVFEIVDGPIGSGGPEGITDHSFANIKSIADTLAGDQQAAGIDPIGLDPSMTGLHNVFRFGDPTAATAPEPVDFYSPDTENYASLDVSADGKTLTVTDLGVNSYPANSFEEASQTGAPYTILSFQLDAIGTATAVPLPPALWTASIMLVGVGGCLKARRRMNLP
jgi:phosphodiesterase/alkaline phosphatase D-like protein